MSNKRPTQAEKILRHIGRYGSITTLTAFKQYGITRLASRIHELRKKGHPIHGCNSIGLEAGRSHTIYYVDETYRANISPKEQVQ